MEDTDTKATPMLGGATGETKEALPEDELYVPVVNANYIPEGVTLQGFVPDTPGDDKVLLRQKEALEAQGHESGPDVEPPPEDFDARAYLGLPAVEEDGPESPTNAPEVDGSTEDPITDSPPPSEESPAQTSDKPLF